MEIAKLLKIREPSFTEINDSFSVTRKIITAYTENIENYIADNLIASLPKDITELLVIDKNKLTKIFTELPEVLKEIKEYIEQTEDILCMEFGGIGGIGEEKQPDIYYKVCDLLKEFNIE